MEVAQVRQAQSGDGATSAFIQNLDPEECFTKHGTFTAVGIRDMRRLTKKSQEHIREKKWKVGHVGLKWSLPKVFQKLTCPKRIVKNFHFGGKYSC